MPTVAQAARFLLKYSDLLRIVAALPVISHVKFSGVLEATAAKAPAKATQAAKAGEEEEERKEEKAAAPFAKECNEKPEQPTTAEAKPSTPAAEEPGYLPPAWALLLLFASEVLNASSLFDSSDLKVRRAAGALLRQQKQSKSTSFTKAFQNLNFLLADEDIYYVVRSAGAICASGSIALSALAGLDRLPGVGGKSPPGPLAATGHAMQNLARALLRPRLLFLAVLFAATVIGHKSLLLKLVKKPGVAELVYALPALLRAMGLSGVALSPDSSILPTYAAMNICASLAHEAHVLVYQRFALPTLFTAELFDAKAKDLGPKTVIAMELWSMLALIPMALRKRRFLVLLPIMAIPCIWLASERPIPFLKDTYAELAIGRLVFCTSLMTVLVLFMGGLQSMTVLVVLVQILTSIHKLDTVKM